MALTDEEFVSLYGELNIEQPGRFEISVLISMLLYVFSLGLLFVGLLYPYRVYERAGRYCELQEYDRAILDYRTVLYYRDGPEQILNVRYLKAEKLLEEGQAEEAKEIFLALGEDNYRDARVKLKECNYRIASDHLNQGDYELASGMFLALDSYRDSKDRYVEAVYQLILEEGHSGRIKESLSRLPVLIENGFFTYSVLPKKDYGAALSLAEPTSVNISADLSGISSQWSFYTGSACVYRITPEYIYFLSAKHVLETVGEAESELTFFDGTRVSAVTEDFFPDDERSDLAMFRIETRFVPVDTLLSLREICFEEQFYEDLREGEEVFLYAAYWYQEETLVGNTVFKGFDAEAASRGNYDNDNYLVFERCSEEGQSGCPVFDSRGRCLALSSSYYYSMYEDRIVYEVDCYCRLDQAETLFLQNSQ